MALRLITPASASPLTLEEAKVWARVDGSAEDMVLNALIAAATRSVEDYTGRALGQQTWELSLDAFASAIEIPKGPVIQVLSVKYDDITGAEQTATTDLYSLDLVGEPQSIVLNSGLAWPATLDRINAVRIQFTAGYPSVAEPLKSIIATLVARWYDDRGDMTIPDGVLGQLRGYRRTLI